MDLPRVTKVIELVSDFSMIAPDVLANAQDRGTIVHGVATAHAMKVPWMQPIPEAYGGFIQSFENWFDAQVVEVVSAEKRLKSAFGYNGKHDLIVHMRTEGLVLVDNKTPLAYSWTWQMQIAAYVQLARENGYPVVKGGTLRLKPDGRTAKMDWLNEEKFNYYLNLFLCALNLHREREIHK